MIKYLLKFTECLLLVMIIGSVADAEIIEAFTDGLEEGDTRSGSQAPAICKLKVTGNYNIRHGHSKAAQRCSVFQGPFNYEVSPIGVHDGDWVQFTSAQTKNCPGGSGWAHKDAFNDDDFSAYSNGECGRAALDGGRTSYPAKGDTSVEATNGRGHVFPLSECRGLKNDGGLGHYHAPRRGHKHGGTDYYAPAGTVLQSPCDGKVTKSYNGDRAGNLIVITCNNGDQFKMMHMHSIPKKAASGTIVQKGQTVGGVGKTGNARSQAPHLHIEAMIGGRRVDPQSLWKCGGDSGH